MSAQRPIHRGHAQVFPGNDNGPEPERRHGIVADTIMALRLFSRLPTGPSLHERPDLNRIAWALPFANLLIGIGPALLLLGLLWAGVPALFSVGVAALALVILSGAMSEDAAADAADGLFGGATRDRRLEILRDSRHGSYGVLAIVFVILLRVVALASIAAISPFGAALCWLAATGMARSAALFPAHRLPPARPDGLAAGAVELRRTGLWGGMAIGGLMTLIMAGPFVGWAGLLLGSGLTIALVAGWTRLCDRLVGGITGDLIGALQALIEIALLATFMVAVVRF